MNGSLTPQNPSGTLEELRAGNVRFAAGETEHPNQDFVTRARLASGQSPHTVLVGCSDSRTPGELVFDQGLGDLFVIRTAGHVIAEASIASIEFGTEVLGASVLLVMGHHSCGAVSAAIKHLQGAQALPGTIQLLADDIAPHVAGAVGEGREEDAPAEHVRATIRAILDRSPLVRAAQDAGTLAVVGAVLDHETGVVTFLDGQGASQAE